MKTSTYFICVNCNKKVSLKAPGTRNRNHCPYCLYSSHVDDKVGDRRSRCGGVMHPIGKIYKKDGEEMIVHQCIKCGFIRKNRVAGDDNWDLVDILNVVNPTDVPGLD